MKDTRKQLADAQRARSLIRFTRAFEDGFVRGYVIDIGPKFFLLALVSDRIWFDGFECFRTSDLKEVRPDPYASFAEAALEARGEHIPPKPSINLASMGELLLTAGQAFPLVTVHCEKVDPDVCWIGRVLGIDRSHLSLLEINPDAKWSDAPRRLRLSEISQVNFGGDYEEALHIVGGAPSAANRRSQTTTNS
jgi:hypothetical protein